MNRNQHEQAPSILLIDKDPEALKQLSTALEDTANVLTATSAKPALYLAKQRKPDLIITGMDLPDCGGLEVCRVLKSERDIRHCAVMVLAETYSEHDELLALEAGAVDFISKPCSPAVLKARIKTQLAVIRHKQRLQSLANKDALTNVFNRRYYENQAHIELKRHYRQQQPLTIALLDIDYFKAYNDAYGHIQGDLCLRDVASEIEACTRRPGEFVARYGGEEFVVLLPNTDSLNARKYGRWICDQILWLAIPHAQSETVPFVTISGGIATAVPDADTSLEDIVQAADEALYAAKKAGRNQFKVSTLQKEMTQEVG